MQEVIPATLMHEDQADRFFAWLRTIHLDREDKRALLRFWTDRVRTPITADIITKAGLK